MSNDTVIPITVYTQSRQTKLGLAVVAIKQEGDLYDASVTITYNDVTFRASAILSDEREASYWAYGVKQNRNDRYAGYTANNGNLIESKPAKNKIAEVISIRDALLESQSNYDNFELAKSSSVGDNVSVKSLTTSALLSDEDKAVMATILAKLGKVTQ